MATPDKSIGRVFIEVGVDLNQLNKGFDQIVKSITDVDGKVAAYGKRLASNFEAAYNPTLKLGKQLEALAAQGKSAGELIAVFGDRIQKTMETVARTGAEPNKIVANLAAQMKVMNQATEGAGSGFARLGQVMTDFARNPLQVAQNGITSLLESMGPLGVGIAGIAGAAIAAGVAIFKMGSDAADAAEQIRNLSASTGMSVEQVQALQRLGKETGVGDLTSKIEMLNIQLGKPEGGEFTEAILRMNIAIKQGAGAVYYLEEIRKKLTEIPDATTRAEVGAAAFGRRLWHDLAPLVMNTSRSITGSLDEIEKSSAVMTESQMEGLTKLDEELDVHGRAWEGLKKRIGMAAGEITLAFYKIIEARPTWEKLFPDWYKPGAAASVPKVPDVGAISSTTVQGRAYEDIAKENTEIERRLKVVAEQDAIATGIRGKLLDLTIRLKEVEAERQKIANESKKGLEFQEERLKQLSAESASLKQAIASEQARMELAKKSAAILQELDRQYQKNIDATTAQANTSEAAWRELDKIIAECRIGLDKFFETSETGFEKMKTDLDSLKFKETFPAEPLGRTAKETLDGMIRVNEQDRKNREDLTKTAETVADVWKNQVSTIVTDWSRGIADILVEGGNFGKKLTDIFRETGKSILRMLIEQLFNPLKKWFSSLFSGLSGGAGAGASSGLGFLGSLGGILGTAAGSIATGGLMGVMIPKTTSGKVLGGIAGGVGGVGAYGAYMGATTAAGAWGGITAAMASIPVWGWAALGATAIGTILYKMFTKSSVEAGAMEASRDLGGIAIGQSTIKSFYASLGISDKQSYGIRKDLLTSPLFVSQIAVPAAQSQGRLDALLKSLERVTVDSRIASSGFLNFRAAVEQGIKTGNWEAFNKQWSEAFAKSQALTAVMPDFASKLAAVASTASDAADAATGLSSGMQALLDAILSTTDAADDMYGTFLKTGEILPQLADEIQKYGGNLAVFQKYASLGPLRENLSAITDLMSGLNNVLPDLGAIQSILQGEGFGAGGWEQLTAMGVDPSKLINMADLVTFEARWEDSVRQFQDTGRLLSGSVLQQALWKFGGTAGATALSRYDQGFNTITPGLLDMTKTAMDAAYKAERSTAMDYLKGVQTTMESEIQAATDAIVEELQKILAAIETGNTATEPVSAAATTPETVAAQGGVYVDMRGATVYGYEDFEGRVQTAWNTAYRRGAFDYAVT